MPVERKNIKHILDFKEEKEGKHLQVEPALLENLGMQLEQIFNDLAHPTPTLRFQYSTTKPFKQFAILDNPEKEKQILLEIDGKHDANLEAVPQSLSIRLLDLQQKKVTRAIFSFGNLGTVSTDFDADTLFDERLPDFQTGKTAEIDVNTPAWFDYGFLTDISVSLDGASRNLVLEQQVVEYYTITDGRYEIVQN